MTHTKTNTQNNTKTRRTPRRNRHLEIKTIFGRVNTFIPLPGSVFDQNITGLVHIHVAVTVTCPTLIQRSMHTRNTVILIRCFNFYFL